MDEPSEGLAPMIIQALREAIGKATEEACRSCWSSRAPPRDQVGRLRARDGKGQVVYSAKPDELR